MKLRIRAFAYVILIFGSARAGARPTGPNLRDLTSEWKACVAENLRRVHADPGRTFSLTERAPVHDFADVTPRRLSQAVRGRRSLSVEQALRLAQWWNVDPEWLLCFDHLRTAFADDYDTLRSNRFDLNRFFYGIAEHAIEVPLNRRTAGRSPYASPDPIPTGEFAPEPPVARAPRVYADVAAAWRQTVADRLTRTIAEAPRSRRLGRNVTAATGLSAQYLGLLKTGQRSTSFEHATRLATYFEVDRNWLLGLDYITSMHQVDPESLAHAWRVHHGLRNSANFPRVVLYALTKWSVETQLWSAVVASGNGCAAYLGDLSAEALAAAIIRKIAVGPNRPPDPKPRTRPAPAPWGSRALSVRPWEPMAYDVIRKVWIW